MISSDSPATDVTSVHMLSATANVFRAAFVFRSVCPCFATWHLELSLEIGTQSRLQCRPLSLSSGRDHI
jgi:hypothetical protein